MQIKVYCAVQMYHLIWHLGLGAWASLTQLCIAQCTHANKHGYMPLEASMEKPYVSSQRTLC